MKGFIFVFPFQAEAMYFGQYLSPEFGKIYGKSFKTNDEC